MRKYQVSFNVMRQINIFTTRFLDHVDIGNIDYVDRFSTILEKSLDDGNEYESESASNYHLSLNYMLGLPPAGFVS